MSEASRWPVPGLSPLSRSLRLRLVAAFVLALVGGAAVALLVDSRITREALIQQTEELLRRDTATLAAALAEDRATLVTAARSAAQELTLLAADGPGGRALLVRELSSMQRRLGVDLAAAIRPDGTTMASVGLPLGPPPRDSLPALRSGPPFRFVVTRAGVATDVAIVPFGADDSPALLIIGDQFDDSRAYELRSLVGHDVLLVVDGEPVGTSLADPTEVPDTATLPVDRPRAVSVGGRERFIQLAPITAPTAGWGSAAMLGVMLPDPLAALDATLTRTRSIGLVVFLAVGSLLAWLLAVRVTRPLLRLASTAAAISDGDPNRSFDYDGSDEIGVLARSLEDMRRRGRRHLRTIERQAAELREASRRIVEAQDRERQRLARDLHDGVQQRLVMLKLRLGMAENRIAADPDVLHPTIRELAESIDATLEGLRTTSQDVFPSILRDRGLDGALPSLTARSPVPAELHCRPPELPRLEPALEASAYFVACEAVTNALKHSGCERISIDVRVDDEVLELTVADDGTGFAPRRSGASHGLANMTDRCVAFGGTLEIDSTPGSGTTIRACFPLP